MSDTEKTATLAIMMAIISTEQYVGERVARSNKTLEQYCLDRALPLLRQAESAF